MNFLVIFNHIILICIKSDIKFKFHENILFIKENRIYYSVSQRWSHTLHPTFLHYMWTDCKTLWAPNSPHVWIWYGVWHVMIALIYTLGILGQSQTLKIPGNNEWALVLFKFQEKLHNPVKWCAWGCVLYHCGFHWELGTFLQVYKCHFDHVWGCCTFPSHQVFPLL